MTIGCDSINRPNCMKEFWGHSKNVWLVVPLMYRRVRLPMLMIEEFLYLSLSIV
jgi:hypothetical protein